VGGTPEKNLSVCGIRVGVFSIRGAALASASIDAYGFLY
jgi:hypothetical protein